MAWESLLCQDNIVTSGRSCAKTFLIYVASSSFLDIKAFLDVGSTRLQPKLTHHILWLDSSSDIKLRLCSATPEIIICLNPWVCGLRGFFVYYWVVKTQGRTCLQAALSVCTLQSKEFQGKYNIRKPLFLCVCFFLPPPPQNLIQAEFCIHSGKDQPTWMILLCQIHHFRMKCQLR